MVCAVAVALTLFATVGSAGARAAGGRGCDGAGQPPSRLSLHKLRSSILCLVNAARERHGVAPLDFNFSLRTSAMRHSVDMVSEGYFAHDGPRGGDIGDRIQRAGYLSRIRAYSLGENIGGGVGRRFGSPAAVYRGWMRSPAHRRNILSPAFRDFGAGVARGFPGGAGGRAATYTLDFGSRR